MTKEGKSFCTLWPNVMIEMPEGTERKILLYWIDIWTPREGVWTHPDDQKRHRKLIKAANRLLEYFEQ